MRFDVYTISKSFSFSASHQLDTLPDTHKCSKLHGHNYAVVLVLRSRKLDRHSFVIDYNDLSPFKEYIDAHLDHRHLNDVLSVSPTAENIAAHLYAVAKKLWKQTTAVRVSETDKTWAEFGE